eukprot:symbB.v1.2.004225.t1/scaffold221.1/size262466/9
MKESRLYELRVHHEQAVQEQNPTAKKSRRKRELTSAEQVRQLCDVMRTIQRRTESKESKLLEKYGLGDGHRRLQSA